VVKASCKQPLCAKQSINQLVFFSRYICRRSTEKITGIGELTARFASQPTLKRNKQKGNTGLWYLQRKAKGKTHIHKNKNTRRVSDECKSGTNIRRATNSATTNNQ